MRKETWRVIFNGSTAIVVHETDALGVHDEVLYRTDHEEAAYDYADLYNGIE